MKSSIQRRYRAVRAINGDLVQIAVVPEEFAHVGQKVSLLDEVGQLSEHWYIVEVFEESAEYSKFS